LGTLHYNAGKYDKAAASFEKGIELDPNAWATAVFLECAMKDFIFQRKNAYFLSDLSRSFRTIFWSILTTQEPYMTLAVELAKLGRMDESRATSMKALEISPNDAYMQYYAACLIHRLGDNELAVNTLKMAMQTGWKDHAWTKGDPDLDPIRTILAILNLMKDK